MNIRSVLNKWAVHLLFEQVALLSWFALSLGTSFLFWESVYTSVKNENMTWIFCAFFVGLYFGCSLFTTRLRMTMSTDFLKDIEMSKGDIAPRVFVFYRRKKSVIWNNIVSSLLMCALLLSNTQGVLMWFSFVVVALYSLVSALLVYLYSLRVKGASLANASIY